MGEKDILQSRINLNNVEDTFYNPEAFHRMRWLAHCHPEKAGSHQRRR